MGSKPKLILQATEGQLKVLSDTTRFLSVVATRRWGKTVTALLKILMAASQCGDRLFWWVAPTYYQAKKPFRMLLKALQESDIIESYSRQELRINLKTGASVEFKSAQIPDNLRCEGLHGLIVEEAGMIASDTWHEVLRPTLADFMGWAFIIYTPKGKGHWTHTIYQRGLSSVFTEYKSFKFTAHDAVFIPASEIKEAEQTLPKKAFRQEFMAEFLDGTGTVFEDIRNHVSYQSHKNESIGIGVDLAKKIDFTVFSAVGADSGVIYDVFRTRRLPYPKQIDLLEAFVNKWYERVNRNPYKMDIFYDQTGVGEAVGDIIQERVSKGTIPISPTGVVFTESRKREIIEEAIVAWESGQLSWSTENMTEDMGVAINEHEIFGLEIGKTGKISYGAPEGFHDDTVISVSLANRARRSIFRAMLERPIPRVSVIGR